jgi:hypothetical protein
MKKTIIQVRGFDCDFQLEVESTDFLSIYDAEEYVQKNIVNTAIVKYVVHENLKVNKDEKETKRENSWK